MQVQAMRLTKTNADVVATWCGGERKLIVSSPAGMQYGVAIATLEGVMLATPGYYIIKGVEGEFYPCKSEIFHKTHKLVDWELDRDGDAFPEQIGASHVHQSA
jgi:hypothetical protein